MNNNIILSLFSIISAVFLFQTQVAASETRNVPLNELIGFSGKTVDTIMKRGKKSRQLEIINGSPSEIKKVTDGLIGDLKKLKYVYSLTPEARQAKWSSEPSLKQLDDNLKGVKGTMFMSETKAIDTYENNDNLLHLITDLHLLGKDQSYAPTLKNAEIELGKYQNDEERKYTEKCGLRRKYSRKDGAIRLLFSKVIQPDQVPAAEVAESSKAVSFHDENGRLCRCTC